MRPSFKILMVIGFLFLAGCAQERGNQVADVPPPAATPPPGRGDDDGTIPDAPGNPSGSGGYGSGSTATLSATASTLRGFFYNSSPNDPKNIRINIDMSRSGENVIIAYDDGGRTVEAAMGTDHPYSGHSNSGYNGWVNQGGQQVWKGFFQDEYGAIVVVIDRTLNLGDGQPSAYIGGSVFYQNFNQYYPNNPQQGPLKMCWEITYGPYDCRTFLVGDSVVMNSTMYPSEGNKGPTRDVGYRKLGEFNGMSRSEAGL